MKRKPEYNGGNHGVEEDAGWVVPPHHSTLLIASKYFDENVDEKQKEKNSPAKKLDETLPCSGGKSYYLLLC